MRQTLRQRVIPAVPAKRDRAKQHLRPPEHGVRLSDDAMRAHSPRPQRPLVDVKLEVHAECELRGQRHKEEFGEHAVRAREELPTDVGMPEDVTSERERDARGLQWDVPAAA
jgi:hypothetical protein